MGFPRQGYWSGLSYPPPGDFPDPGIEPAAPALQADSLPLSHQGHEGGCHPPQMLTEPLWLQSENETTGASMAPGRMEINT